MDFDQYTDIKFFLTTKCKFPGLRSLVLRYDHTTLYHDNTYYAPVDDLFEHARNNLKAMHKGIKQLTPIMINNMFYGYRMWKKDLCYLYALIKKPLDIFKNEYEFHSINKELNVKELRFLLDKGLVGTAWSSFTFQEFVLEVVYQKLREFESLETVDISGFIPCLQSLNLEHILKNRKLLKMVHHYLFCRVAKLRSNTAHFLYYLNDSELEFKYMKQAIDMIKQKRKGYL